MSDRMECPGCGSFSSTVLIRYQDGADCPFCGLSNAAMTEIGAVRKSKADKDLIEKYEAAVKELAAARAETAKARRFLDAIERALCDLGDES